jgi:L-tartrate/succinate antiporter
MWIGICVTQISSSFFLTGLAPNLLALSIARDTVQVTITWQEWFMAMLPAGVALTMLTPLLTYYIYPPTEKNFPAVPGWAAAELEKMGPISQKEIIMASLAIFALGMWIFGTKLMDSTLVSLVVLALMLLFGVVTWEQVISNKQAWNMFCWFGTLITLAGGLAQTGFLKWFATHSTTAMVGLPPMGVAFGVLVLFYFTHYFFAGVTSHATAQIAIMLTIGMTIPGMDIKYFTMFLCGSLGIMGILTPYGGAHNTIYFGTGYIKSSTFWLLGAIFGVFNFAVYSLFAVLWMPRVFG